MGKAMQRSPKKRKRRSEPGAAAGAPWKTALAGIAAAWLCTAVGLILSSFLFYMEWIPSGSVQYQTAAYLILLISLLAGAAVTFRRTGGRERVWILGTLAGYLLIRFLLSSILTFL